MKMIMRALAAGVLLFFSFICPVIGAAQKTEIRVRVLDAHSGKPYVNRELGIFGANSSSGVLYAKDTLFELRAKTGAEGVARFEVTLPLPKSLVIHGYQVDICGPSPWIVTEQVMRTGTVMPNTCARKHQKYDWQDISAQPGEIVVFALEPRLQW